ncbi:MAG: DUF1566 domain-containing protein [Candidatus Nanopelagicales bacterium]|nr:DUF1566 domain-containing protein [Candidatus Nanopelagicales bacterium]
MRLKLSGIGALAASIALVLAACSSQTEPARDVATTPTTSAPACVVGEPGPGGGTIFYQDMSRPAGSRCFEAAPSGWYGHAGDPDERLAWGTGKKGTGKCASTSIATRTGIGTGEANTTAITSDDACDTPEKAPAAWAAKNYAGGEKSDWFLPSMDELNQLYIQKAAVGGFAGVIYWSSSVFDLDHAWYQSFDDGVQDSRYKLIPLRVRPVRAF